MVEVSKDGLEVPFYVDLPAFWQVQVEDALGNSRETGSSFSVHPQVRPVIGEVVWNVLRKYFRTKEALALATLQAERDRYRVALETLADAEAGYRSIHDIYGDDSPKAERAWDLMRRAGDIARTALSDTPTVQS